MGNCCLKGSRSSTMVWADETDQWVYYSDPNLQQKQSLLSDERLDNRSEHSVSVKGREVKIMLSKRRLEELVGKMEDVHSIPVNQILECLISTSDRFEIDIDRDDDHRSCTHYHLPWKPNLQSIPEES